MAKCKTCGTEAASPRKKCATSLIAIKAEPTRQERKPSWKLDFLTAQNAKKLSAPR